MVFPIRSPFSHGFPMVFPINHLDPEPSSLPAMEVSLKASMPLVVDAKRTQASVFRSVSGEGAVGRFESMVLMDGFNGSMDNLWIIYG